MLTDTVMESFVIEGGRPLSGSIRATGNKNAALPIIAACLLTDEPVTLPNVPAIRDVATMLELAADLGVEVEHARRGRGQARRGGRRKTELDEELCRRIRASILFAGPLARALGRGDRPTARRRRDRSAAPGRPHGRVRAPGRRAPRGPAPAPEGDGPRGRAQVFLDEASVTGTENAVMAAVLARGETIIGNAACEPHVQDLCRFLVSLGAEIEGIGSNVLGIRGVDRLRGGEWRICPDHIEVASFIGLGAVTEGEIVIEDVNAEDLVAVWPGFERLGVGGTDGTSVRVARGAGARRPGRPRLADPEDRGRPLARVPADLTSIALAVATQARGTCSSSRRCSRTACSSWTSS